MKAIKRAIAIIKESGGIQTSEGWEVGGDLDISGLELTELPLIKRVVGNFNCSCNRLVSLKGGPEKVGEAFNCSYNELTSLSGSPSEVGGDYNCTYNALVSLTGSPKKVGGHFYCSYNKLKNLLGSPAEVGGDYYCTDNILNFTKSAVKFVSKVVGRIIVSI